MPNLLTYHNCKLDFQVQWWKHPGSCAFAEPVPLSQRKHKHVVQNEKEWPLIPNYNHNFHGENDDAI